MAVLAGIASLKLLNLFTVVNELTLLTQLIKTNFRVQAVIIVLTYINFSVFRAFITELSQKSRQKISLS